MRIKNDVKSVNEYEKNVWLEWFKQGKIDSDFSVEDIKKSSLADEFKNAVKKQSV